MPEGTVVTALLAVGPPLCWVAAVLWRRPPRPFLTIVVIGALLGCSWRPVTKCSGIRRWGWTRRAGRVGAGGAGGVVARCGGDVEPGHRDDGRSDRGCGRGAAGPVLPASARRREQADAPRPLA
ncbi:hypothetical protein V2I01_20775 [Micromonospora sp. BRA006-A]|nr:hypothetical protein [Micromonospora sp. BRA006-A]